MPTPRTATQADLEPQAQLDVRIDGPVERGAEVMHLRRDELRVLRGTGECFDREVGRFGQFQVVLGVTAAQVVGFPDR